MGIKSFFKDGLELIKGSFWFVFGLITTLLGWAGLIAVISGARRINELFLIFLVCSFSGPILVFSYFRKIQTLWYRLRLSGSADDAEKVRIFKSKLGMVPKWTHYESIESPNFKLAVDRAFKIQNFEEPRKILEHEISEWIIALRGLYLKYNMEEGLQDLNKFNDQLMKYYRDLDDEASLSRITPEQHYKKPEFFLPIVRMDLKQMAKALPDLSSN